MGSKITVLKFGSSVLRDEADLPRAVHEIYRHWRNGTQVLVVVSAFGQTTDELLGRAESIADDPHPHSVAALLATGEAASASLLEIALHRAGIPVSVQGPAQLGLRTAGEILDAEPVDVDIANLREQLRTSVVVVSGFVGVDEDGGPTLLGRGGSDLTALFLAHKLEAEAILVKDVDGLYESDPNETGPRPRRFERANYRTAIRVGDCVVQEKAVRFAEEASLRFTLASTGSDLGTLIYSGADELLSPAIKRPPLRVALLGCGTVGGGVYKALAAQPQFFDVVAVADRNRDKTVAVDVPAEICTTDATDAIERDCDVVVELFGGTSDAGACVEHALKLGRHVVTANKALLAERIDELEYLAEQRGSNLRYSAAVGGVMPALETVSRTTGLRSFSGIVNGTCNFICDELAKGVQFGAAVRSAQAAGFAEADPTADISGADAAQKLSLLARAAFRLKVTQTDISVEGVAHLDAEQVLDARTRGKTVRLIAECERTPDGIRAQVRSVELDSSHPLGQVKGAENRLLLQTEDGQTKSVSGRGAGRWPTTEAVVADLLDIYRESIPAKHFTATAAVAAAQEVYA